MKIFRAGIIIFCTVAAGAVLSTALLLQNEADYKETLSSPDCPVTEYIPADLNLDGAESSVNEEKDGIDINITDITDRSISEDEITLIAELVEAEAKDRSYMTRVCCAAVIFNRVADVSFPSTVHEVVYQPGAFHFDGSSDDLSYSRSFKLTMAAVREAALGRDPTDGALYFADAEDKTAFVVPSFECGGMIFGK